MNERKRRQKKKRRRSAGEEKKTPSQEREGRGRKDVTDGGSAGDGQKEGWRRRAIRGCYGSDTLTIQTPQTRKKRRRRGRKIVSCLSVCLSLSLSTSYSPSLYSPASTRLHFQSLSALRETKITQTKSVFLNFLLAFPNCLVIILVSSSWGPDGREDSRKTVEEEQQKKKTVTAGHFLTVTLDSHSCFLTCFLFFVSFAASASLAGQGLLSITSQTGQTCPKRNFSPSCPLWVFSLFGSFSTSTFRLSPTSASSSTSSTSNIFCIFVFFSFIAGGCSLVLSSSSSSPLGLPPVIAAAAGSLFFLLTRPQFFRPALARSGRLPPSLPLRLLPHQQPQPQGKTRPKRIEKTGSSLMLVFRPSSLP